MRTIFTALAAGILGGICANSHAIPVVAVNRNGDVSLETQGVSGRFLLALPSGQTRFSNQLAIDFILDESTQGVTTDGQYVYASGVSGSVTQISKVSLNDPNSFTLMNVNRPLADIAYTNGQLYGVVKGSTTTSVEIVRILPNGTLATIATQATPGTGSGVWRLSGASAGNNLIATRGGISGARPAYAFNAQSGASTYSFTPALPQGQILGSPMDTAIEVDDSSLTYITGSVSGTGGQQPRVSLPSGAAQSGRPLGQMLGETFGLGLPKAVSDEVNLSFPASSQAQTSTTLAGSAEFGTYSRQKGQFSGTISYRLDNGVAPDGVMLSSVESTVPVVQTSGATPLTIMASSAAPGSFTPRTLATATVQLDLSTAARGIYTLQNGPITATYNSEVGRTVFANTSQLNFAYEPPSGNVVNNGDLTLQGYGWTKVAVANGITDPADRHLRLTSASSIATASQSMALPMAEGAMRLEFDYRSIGLNPLAEPGDFTAYIGGHSVADLQFSSAISMTGFQHFSTLVDLPTLYGQSGIELRLELNGNYVDAEG